MLIIDVYAYVKAGVRRRELEAEGLA